jgi:hypothetical protein
MRRDEQLRQLTSLKEETQAWRYDADAQTYTAQVDDYTLVVQKVRHHSDSNSALERGNVNAEWSVRHARYGELMPPTPSTVALYAKREAIDFTRAHLLGQPEPEIA